MSEIKFPVLYLVMDEDGREVNTWVDGDSFGRPGSREGTFRTEKDAIEALEEVKKHPGNYDEERRDFSKCHVVEYIPRYFRVPSHGPDCSSCKWYKPSGREMRGPDDHPDCGRPADAPFPACNHDLRGHPGAEGITGEQEGGKR